MEVERCENEKGEVAVLYSPGFGTGWSTWAWEDNEEFLAMDRGLVELALNGKNEEDVKKYCDGMGYDRVCMGGWCGIRVAWMPKKTRFRIDEFDGSERIVTLDDLWMTT